MVNNIQNFKTLLHKKIDQLQAHFVQVLTGFPGEPAAPEFPGSPGGPYTRMNWYIHEKLGYSFLQVSHQRHLVQILQDHHGYPTTNTLAFKLLTGSSCKSLTGSPGKPICPTSPSTPLTQANKQLILFLPIPALSFLLSSSLLYLYLSHTCT